MCTLLGQFQGALCGEISAQGSAQTDLITNQVPILRQGTGRMLGPYAAYMKAQIYLRNVFRFPSSSKLLKVIVAASLTCWEALERFHRSSELSCLKAQPLRVRMLHIPHCLIQSLSTTFAGFLAHSLCLKSNAGLRKIVCSATFETASFPFLIQWKLCWLFLFVTKLLIMDLTDCFKT